MANPHPCRSFNDTPCSVNVDAEKLPAALIKLRGKMHNGIAALHCLLKQPCIAYVLAISPAESNNFIALRLKQRNKFPAYESAAASYKNPQFHTFYIGFNQFFNRY